MGARPARFADFGAHELDALAEAVAAFERLFAAEFGLPIYLSWGTLLGAARERNFIGHDTDIDLAYLSAAATDFEIVEENETIVRVLRDHGLTVQRHTKGQLHVNVARDETTGRLPAYNLDVWTTWVRDGRYFHYPDIKGDIAAAAVTPLVRRAFRGERLLMPVDPASVLRCFYGDGWREPDPGYAWYPRYSSTDVFEFLRQAPTSTSIPPRPRRAANLSVAEHDDHFFITAPHIHEAQRLNASAMLILELCTGSQSPADIIGLLQQAFRLPSAPEVVVLEFLTHAAATGLLEPAPGPTE
jgi:hypothetical protein